MADTFLTYAMVGAGLATGLTVVGVISSQTGLARQNPEEKAQGATYESDGSDDS